MYAPRRTVSFSGQFELAEPWGTNTGNEVLAVQRYVVAAIIRPLSTCHIGHIFGRPEVVIKGRQVKFSGAFFLDSLYANRSLNEDSQLRSFLQARLTGELRRIFAKDGLVSEFGLNYAHPPALAG
jgi:hypothetical protein